MSEGPARIAVSIRTQKDKYGPGAELFIGADDPEGLEVHLQKVLGSPAAQQVLDLAKAQVAIEAARLDSGAVEAAVQNLQGAGLNPQPAQQADDWGATPTPPDPWSGQGNGGDTPQKRLLGKHPVTGAEVYARFSKNGNLHFSMKHDGAYFNGFPPKGVTMESVTLNTAVEAINKKRNEDKAKGQG